MASTWYCKTKVGEQGPLSVAELQALVAEGVLTEQGFVRKGVAQKWHLAGKVKGLFPAPSKEDAPQPFPPTHRAAEFEAAKPTPTNRPPLPPLRKTPEGSEKGAATLQPKAKTPVAPLLLVAGAVGAFFLLIVVLIAGAAVYFVGGRNHNDENETVAAVKHPSESEQPEQAPDPPAPSLEEIAAAEAKKKAAEERAAIKKAEEKAAEKKAEKTREQQLAAPFSALQQNPYRLNAIPKYKRVNLGVEENDSERPVRLGTLYNESPQKVEIELLGSAMLRDNRENNTPLQIKPVEEKSNGVQQRVWQIFSLSSGLVKRQRKIAQLTLEGEELRFQWLPLYKDEKTQQRSLLQFHALRITVGEVTQVCQLFEPRVLEIENLAWRRGNHSLVKHPESLHVPELDFLIQEAPQKTRLLAFQLESPVENDGKTVVLTKDRHTITFLKNADDPTKTIKMEWWYQSGNLEKTIGYFFSAAEPAVALQGKKMSLGAKPFTVKSERALADEVGTEELVALAAARKKAQEALVIGQRTHQAHKNKEPKAPKPNASQEAKNEFDLKKREWLAAAKNLPNLQSLQKELAKKTVLAAVAEKKPGWKEHVEKTLDAICNQTKIEIVLALQFGKGDRVILARSAEDLHELVPSAATEEIIIDGIDVNSKL